MDTLIIRPYLQLYHDNVMCTKCGRYNEIVATDSDLYVCEKCYEEKPIDLKYNN